MTAADQAARTLALLNRTPGWHRLRALRPDADPDTVAAILDAGVRLVDEVLTPLDDQADRVGSRLQAGRVTCPPAFAAAWRAMGDGGWIGLDLPESFGGSGLPLVVQAAAQQLLDRGGIAFNMGWGASRSAAHLLAERAPDLAADWVPALIAGERAATICISEPGAGSDVGRIRTRAVQGAEGWRITGSKCWISYGDHDAVPLIGHCLLARTSDAPGTRGLSLFLVPSRCEGAPNGITISRIEEKLGLHGSPTCVMDFDGAQGWLIGTVDRGLSQLFTMIELMRLQTGCHGLGAASRACDLAQAYAADRLQGGPPGAPPVAIATHPDVRRQLGRLRARTEILRAAVLELAATMDLARLEPEGDHAALAAFLLPLVKTFGAETGFDVASGTVQVLGGAGYTREWPAERILRDTRILSIFEGTTGMQGIDFLERRLVRDRSGFDAFLARADAPRLAALADRLVACPDETRRLTAADAWLRLGWLAVTAWLAPRLDPADAAIATAQLAERMAVHEAEIKAALAT